MTTIPIIRTTHRNLETDVLKEGYSYLPFHIKKSDGKRGLGIRQCTKYYKILPVIKSIRERLGYKKHKKVIKHKVNMFIGISLDEIQRVKPAQSSWITNCYPLIDKKLTRKDCIEFLTPLMGTPPRSSCYFCPYKSDAEWLKLKEDPNMWKKVIEIDQAIRKQANDGVEAYLHKSLKPIDEVPLENNNKKEIDLFNNECEGMCGV